MIGVLYFSLIEPQPRYLSNYVGLRNRLSVLNEQYPYADFETRLRGCYDLMFSFLEFAHANRDAMVRLVRDADRRTLARGHAPAGSDGFVVEWSQEAVAERVTVQGYEMEVTDGPGGWPRVKPTDRKKTYRDLPYLAKYTPKRTVRWGRSRLARCASPSVGAQPAASAAVPAGVGS